MAVTVETTKVYKGGGRRWFTRRAAERAEAKAIVRKHCECDDGNGVTPPYACQYHKMEPMKFQRMIHLLVVMFVRKGIQQ